MARGLVNALFFAERFRSSCNQQGCLDGELKGVVDVCEGIDVEDLNVESKDIDGGYTSGL